MAHNKLLVIMIDGISAEDYALSAARLPHLRGLAERGFRVHNLHAEVIGVSLPGRTSILTGATADVSGVYANYLLEGDTFRYATPDDVRVPTLPARATAAGLDVACLGFGMVRPEDTTLFKAPWWAGETIQRGRDAEPQPASPGLLRAARHDPGERFREMCQQAGLTPDQPVFDTFPDAYKPFFGLVADHWMADRVGAVATAAAAPDLILTEFLITDSFQHDTGYRSGLAQWALEQADLAVGKILQRLAAAGVLAQWHVAVLSDHGHSPIATALYPRNIYPGLTMLCEGSFLLALCDEAAQHAALTAALAPYGVQPYPNTCLPPELRQRLHTFVAPQQVAFEDAPAGSTAHSGPPAMISSHGLRPGAPGDDRFALFAGPRVPPGHCATAAAVQVAPTLAALLGLSTADYAAAPIFMPV
ncbi:MAG: alkaline phosphatase family protein [Anaerolineae bacterium]|nr:alkaline phosphatase family protein [Anaerolineae bacterium]